MRSECRNWGRRSRPVRRLSDRKLKYQIVVLDDLIPGKDQRVDVAPGEEQLMLMVLR